MDRLWIVFGSLCGGMAVALAAWRAHGLAGSVEPAALAALDSALAIQGWHALALLAAGLVAARGARLAAGAGACFALGTILFCGAVWLSALWGVRFGPVAPLGGGLLILGWLLLAAAGLARSRP